MNSPLNGSLRYLLQPQALRCLLITLALPRGDYMSILILLCKEGDGLEYSLGLKPFCSQLKFKLLIGYAL